VPERFLPHGVAMQIRQLPVPQLPVALLAHLFLQLPSPFSPSKSFLLPSFTFSHRNRFRPPTFTFTPLVFGPLMCGLWRGIRTLPLFMRRCWRTSLFRAVCCLIAWWFFHNHFPLSYWVKSMLVTNLLPEFIIGHRSITRRRLRSSPLARRRFHLPCYVGFQFGRLSVDWRFPCATMNIILHPPQNVWIAENDLFQPLAMRHDTLERGLLTRVVWTGENLLI